MMERRREQKEHGTREFPFQIYSAPDAKDSDLVPYHWHPEVEIITVLQGEVSVTINETVRGSDFFLIQSTCKPVNNNLMELLTFTDAESVAERL